MNDTLSADLDRHGLARVREALLAQALPSIRLMSQRVDEMHLRIGASKIGGHPDLPASASWPSWRDKPLSFLAQVNLAELPRCEAATCLPSSGLLYFFYDAERSTWGFDPAHAGSWKVLFTTDSVEDLMRRDWPGGFPEHARFRARAVTFSEESYTLPPYPSLLVDSLRLTKQELDGYLDLQEACADPDEGTAHRLLGHPDVLQGDMQLECQLVSNGVYCGDEKWLQDPRRKQLEPGYKDWKLLFQLDSDDGAGMMWGDAGRLYFWTRSEALAERRFDDTWMILECY